MKLCEDYAALLDLYVDGELSLEELERVQAHLETCPACRAYVDDALAISAAFPDGEDTEVPAGFADGVMARIRAEAPHAPKKQKKTPWVGVLASLAACCVIVILQQGGPLAGGSSEPAVDDTAGIVEMAEDAPAEGEPAVDDTAGIVEMAEDAPAEGEPADTVETCGQSAARTGGDSAQYSAAAVEALPTALTDAAEDAGDPGGALKAADEKAASGEEAADGWVEGPGGNVIFRRTVYLTAADVGDALDGYEGKPFSIAQEPEKGVIGTGYALTQAELERILRDVPDRPAETEAEAPTTELCCIVVTEG